MTRLTILAAVVALTFAASAQQPPQFRSGVDLVTLDLTAMGPDGSPIPDLRAEEITITVLNRPRRIRSFEYVAVAPVSRAAAKGPGAGVAPGTNLETGMGRTVFVLVFHEHIRPGNERIAMEGVRRIIDQLEPRDRVAILTMPFGRVEVDLTADHERAKSRLHQIIGRSDPGDPVATGSKTNSESLNLLAFLKDITPLAGPKTVLLISEGFQTGSVFDERDTTLTSAPALLDRPETAAVVPLLNNVAALQGEISDLRTAAAAARAQFYVIQPYNFPVDAAFKNPGREGLGNSPYATLATQNSALAALAGVLGGRYIMLSGASAPVFDRIVRETSGYYALAFETEAEDREGKADHVEVATSRKGVTLRARRTFLDPLPPARKAATITVQAMLSEGASYTGVPLRASAFVSRAADGQVKVMALAESLAPKLKDAGFVLVNSKNVVVASWPAELPAGAGPIVSAQIVPTGHYRLRAAAVDTNGIGGAVDYEFDASLATIGPLLASSLMTGVQEAATFRPRLVFTPGDDLVPYFEIYGTAEDVEAAFELVRSSGGAALAVETATQASTRDADRWIVSATLPLGSVPAGDYILRAIVRIGAQAAGTLTASIRVVP